MAKSKTATKTSDSVAPKVVAKDTQRLLYELQQVDSQIDAFVQLRGALPVEVQDL